MKRCVVCGNEFLPRYNHVQTQKFCSVTCRKNNHKPKTWFVYVDVRLNDYKPFYVGVGSAARVTLRLRNKYHKRICFKYGMNRFVVLETNDRNKALQTEIDLIRVLMTRNTFGGANFTDGGEGTSGWSPSEQTRKKIGLKNRGKKRSSDALTALRTRMLGQNNPNYGNLSAIRTNVTCVFCQKESTRRKSKINNNNFCSLNCMHSHHKLTRLGNKNPNYKVRVPSGCQVCGSTFYVTQNTLEKGYKLTCSHECSKKLLSMRTKQYHANQKSI